MRLPFSTVAIVYVRHIAKIEAGARIEHACEDACALRVMMGSDIGFTFNGTPLVATQKSTADSLVAEFYSARGGA